MGLGAFSEEIEMPKVLLISVGGTPEAVVHSLGQHRPEYVIFFASRQSEGQVSGILKELDFQPKFRQIVTPSAEDLEVCFEVLWRRLPEVLEEFGASGEDLVVDYTGGTKTMSAAVVLATVQLGARYSYVGGVERDKGGLGVVIGGKERMLYLANPWDKLAVAEEGRIALYFNSARYSSALEVVKELKGKVTEGRRPFYELLEDLIAGYDLWDKFKHKSALPLLNKGLDRLRAYVAGDRKMGWLLEKVDENARFLREVQKDEELLVPDLLANAKRRAELEGKYDDGVARLYRALEMAMQVRLKRYGIDPSRAEPGDIPEGLREEFVRRYSREDGRLKLGLEAGYEVLEALGDELGRRFSEGRRRLRSWTNRRNESILAHGKRPVSEEDFKGFYEFSLEFLGIDEGKLPSFPELRF